MAAPVSQATAGRVGRGRDHPSSAVVVEPRPPLLFTAFPRRIPSRFTAAAACAAAAPQVASHLRAPPPPLPCPCCRLRLPRSDESEKGAAHVDPAPRVPRAVRAYCHPDARGARESFKRGTQTGCRCLPACCLREGLCTLGGSWLPAFLVQSPLPKSTRIRV